MIRFVISLLVLSAWPLSADARAGTPAALFDTPALSEADLAEQRAGFALPGGIELALGVRVATDVNGQRLLETTLNIDASGARAATRTANGTVTAIDPRGAAVLATLPGLSVEHIVGQRIASVIANSANNQVIDHRVTVDLSLGNVPALSLGSAIFRVQSVGMDAGQWRALGG